MSRPVLISLCLTLAAPSSAAAHAVISIGGGVLAYRSEDTGSASRLEIRASFAGINVYDPGTFGGMQAPISCRPGRTDATGNPIEFFCPSGGVEGLRVDVMADEDRVDISGPFPRYVDGGFGADTIRTGEEAAEIRGSEGNDVVVTGPRDDQVHLGAGADTADTGGGADRIDSADGELDQVRCGDGADTATVDQLDSVDVSCETVQRSVVAPPRASAEGDVTAPRLAASAASVQRVSRRRVTFTATSSEGGSVSASAYLETGGVRRRMTSVTRKVTARRRTTVVLRLSATHIKRIRRDLAAGRRPRVSIRVAAEDRAGNVSTAKTLRIRLRR